MSIWVCATRAPSPRTAARSRSSIATLNFSVGPALAGALSHIMCLPSTSSPTTLSSRMASPHRPLDAPAPGLSAADFNAGSGLLGADTLASGSKSFDHPVDARGERTDVVGLYGREHGNPQLVAAEFAVG